MTQTASASLRRSPSGSQSLVEMLHRFEGMRAHVDEGGKLSHANAVELLSGLEELCSKLIDVDEALSLAVGRIRVIFGDRP